MSFINTAIDLLKDDLQFGLICIGVALIVTSPIIFGVIFIIRRFFRNNFKYKIYEQLNARYSAGEYLVIKCEFLGIIKRHDKIDEVAVKLPNNCCHIGKFDRLKESTGETYLVLIEYETETVNKEYVILF